MEYTHAVVDPDMCDARLLARFRAYLATPRQFHYQQDPDWFVCSAGSTARLLITSVGEEIVASSLLHRVRYRLTGKARYLVRNGPVYRDIAALAAHLEWLLGQLSGDAMEIRVSPPSGDGTGEQLDQCMQGAGFRRYHDVRGNYTHTITLDLHAGEDIGQRFSHALKRQLGKADRLHLRAEAVNSAEDLRALLTRIREFYQSRGIGLPREELLDCYLQRRMFRDGDAIALVLKQDDEPLAGIIVIGCGDRALFSYGFRVTDAAHGNLPLTHLLHYRSILWAQQQGFRVYDFGGYGEEPAYSGTNRFKLSFGGSVEQVSVHYLYSFLPAYTLAFGMLDRIRSLLTAGRGAGR